MNLEKLKANQSVLTRLIWLFLGILLQLFQFRTLIAADFVYLSIITIASGVISQLDLGFSNLLTSSHLRENMSTGSNSSEWKAIYSKVLANLSVLIWIILFWLIISISIAFWPTLLGFSAYEGSITTYVLASCALLMNSISAFTSKIMLAIGLKNKLQHLQLISILIQFGLYVFHRNLNIALAGLFLFPVLLHLYILGPCKKSSRMSQIRMEKSTNYKMIEFNLQLVQIVGVITTLVTPFLAIHFLSEQNTAALQLQLKISSVLITIGGAFYLSIQRDSYKTLFMVFKKQVLLASIVSLILAVATVLAIHIGRSSIGLQSDMPSPVSWFALISFVSLQPINIGLFYLLLRDSKFRILLLSGLLNLGFLVALLVIFSPRYSIDAFFPSILVSSCVSSIPMLKNVRFTTSSL